MGKKQFCFFQTAETGNRTPDSGVKGSGANHYPRAPAPNINKHTYKSKVYAILKMSHMMNRGGFTFTLIPGLYRELVALGCSLHFILILLKEKV